MLNLTSILVAIGVFFVLQVCLVYCRFAEIINWSWWIVYIPLIVFILIVLFLWWMFHDFAV